MCLHRKQFMVSTPSHNKHCELFLVKGYGRSSMFRILTAATALCPQRQIVSYGQTAFHWKGRKKGLAQLEYHTHLGTARLIIK